MAPARPRRKKSFLQRFPAIKIPFGKKAKTCFVEQSVIYLFIIITASSRLVSIFSVEKEVRAAVKRETNARFFRLQFSFHNSHLIHSRVASRSSCASLLIQFYSVPLSPYMRASTSRSTAARNTEITCRRLVNWIWKSAAGVFGAGSYQRH